jgi:hypothetical protein
LSDGYYDVELQIITLLSEYNASGGDDEKNIVAKDTPTGDLDRNELAEILFVRAVITVSHRDDGSEYDQTSTGNTRLDFSAHINERAADESVDILETSGNRVPSGQTVATSAPDAANEIFQGNLVVHPMFQDATNGTSGGSDGAETLVLETNYMELGGGPIVDRFDDVVVSSNLNSTNIVTEVKSEMNVQFWYKVAEFEDRGIQSFGRP